MRKETYETPLFESIRVEMEEGIMKASVFEPEDGHDKGVTIEGHGFGNSQDFTGSGWDDDPSSSSSSF